MSEVNFIAVQGVVDLGDAAEDAILHLNVNIDSKLSFKEQVRLAKNIIHLEKELSQISFENKQTVVGLAWPDRLKAPYEAALLQVSRAQDKDLH